MHSTSTETTKCIYHWYQNSMTVATYQQQFNWMLYCTITVRNRIRKEHYLLGLGKHHSLGWNSYDTCVTLVTLCTWGQFTSLMSNSMSNKCLYIRDISHCKNIHLASEHFYVGWEHSMYRMYGQWRSGLCCMSGWRRSIHGENLSFWTTEDLPWIPADHSFCSLRRNRPSFRWWIINHSAERCQRGRGAVINQLF